MPLFCSTKPRIRAHGETADHRVADAGVLQREAAIDVSMRGILCGIPRRLISVPRWSRVLAGGTDAYPLGVPPPQEPVHGAKGRQLLRSAHCEFFAALPQAGAGRARRGTITMTEKKHLKKIIRQRQAETGERYTTARARVLEAEERETVEAFVLKVGSASARLRPLRRSAEEDFTFRTSSAFDLVPGAIVRLQVVKRWTWNKHTYVSGDLLGSYVNVAKLGLRPVRVHEQGLDEYEYDFADTVPPGDPVSDATDLMLEGDLEAAEDVLMRVLGKDIRCIDAHAHLGNIALRRNDPELARQHYEVGLQIGALSFADLAAVKLPYGWLSNRPFLRALQGHAIASWRLGRFDEALAAMERLMQIDPDDCLGARFVVGDLAANVTWEHASANWAE